MQPPAPPAVMAARTRRGRPMSELPSYDELPGRAGGRAERLGPLRRRRQPRPVQPPHPRAGARGGPARPPRARSSRSTPRSTPSRPPIAGSRGVPRHHVLHAPGHHRLRRRLRQLLPPGVEPVGLPRARRLRRRRLLQRGHRGRRGQRAAQHHRPLGPAGHRRPRACVLDMVADPGRGGPALRARASSTAFSVEDLELARERAGSSSGPGDILHPPHRVRRAGTSTGRCASRTELARGP